MKDQFAFRSGIVLAFLAYLAPVCAQPLSIGGVGAALGAMQRLAEVYAERYPGSRLVVLPSMGSAGGIRATADGRLDIGVAGRPMTGQERTYGLTRIPYASTPAVFAVNRDLPVVSITSAEIRAFYEGKSHHWPGGQRCRPILRPARDSETLALKKMAPQLGPAIEKALRTPGIYITLTAQDNADVVAATPGGFGYTTLALVLSEHRPLRALIYDGVEPTLENLSAGRYPLSMTLYLVIRTDATEEAHRFVDFVKSAQGGSILRALGNLPLP